MPVHFSYLDFGVGTVSVPIGSTKINLGVKGSANCPAFASMPWTTPATPGHYCIQVLLEPADDLNWNNNLGQENTNVGKAHSPAVFTFTLRNNTQRQQRYTFEVDTYVPGPPDPCDETRDGTAIAADFMRSPRLNRHRRGAQPVPTGWLLNVSPGTPSLAPGVTIPITVTATSPPGFTGSQQLND